MAKKGDNKSVYEEKVGIRFSIAELVGALSMAQCDWFTQDHANSCLEVVVTFKFIGCSREIGVQAGIDCKQGSLEHFLAEHTCLRSKIEDAVTNWIAKKQFEEMVTCYAGEGDDESDNN